MASPAPAWNLIRVYGTWHNLSGTMKAGAYKVTVPQRITSVTDDVIIPAGVFATGSLSISPAVPSLDILVPAVDDPDISPQNGYIIVEVSFNDGSANETFNIQPSVTGGAVNLRAIVLPSSAPPVADLLYRGVPGGLAELDADGDVIDADGVKVTGSGSGPTTATGITVDTTAGLAGPDVQAALQSVQDQLNDILAAPPFTLN